MPGRAAVLPIFGSPIPMVGDHEKMVPPVALRMTESFEQVVCARPASAGKAGTTETVTSSCVTQLKLSTTVTV